MKQIFTVVTIALFVLISSTTFSQQDTLFWFAAPDVSSGEGDSPIQLKLLSYGTSSDVTISQPANGGFVPILVSLAANSSQSVDLTAFLAQIESPSGNAVNSNGLKITATNPISVYYEVNAPANKEIFTLKGNTALGLEFYTPFQKNKNNAVTTPASYSSFEIIASEDNTTVLITPEKILPETSLTFKDVDGLIESFTLTTDSKGYYEKTLKAGQEIFIKAQKKKYFADAEVVNTKKITESTNIIQDFYLNPIPQDDIEIEGIEYDFDSDKLRPASMAILDRLFDFLELNQNLIVEINSHTDCTGSDSYNQKLSARRAKSCVDYLLSKGVPKDRLTSKGYGESEPNFLKDADKQAVLDVNGDRILLTEAYINGVESKDEQEVLHQYNRRTSFKVVGEDFQVISK